MNKMILDVTCGNRGIWFQKHEPHTIYCDKRFETIDITYPSGRYKYVIEPDIMCDFTKLPFDDNTFHLVVIDPPHLCKPDNGLLKKEYGVYRSKNEAIDNVSKGIRECMRVLKCGGLLIFKWNELDISTREIIDACGITPLFGHKSGKKSNTHWMCFMKFEEEEHDADN